MATPNLAGGRAAEDSLPSPTAVGRLAVVVEDTLAAVEDTLAAGVGKPVPEGGRPPAVVAAAEEGRQLAGLEGKLPGDQLVEDKQQLDLDCSLRQQRHYYHNNIIASEYKEVFCKLLVSELACLMHALPTYRDQPFFFQTSHSTVQCTATP